MSSRYDVIGPDTLEAMRRAGHAAKLEARIEKLEAALFSIYVAPNDIPFIKAQIDSVLDVNECRQKWVGEK
jgi:hypothetical protein